MANSLKSRLFLNNFFLIFIVFLFLAAGLILVFTNSPASYRQTTLRLKLLEGAMVERITNEGITSQDEIGQFLTTKARAAQVRFLVVAADQKILFDTGKNSYPSLSRVNIAIEKVIEDEARLFPLRDDLNNRWLYTAAPIDGERTLITMIPRPILAVANILRDEVFMAMFRAIVISLIVAFGLSLITARWITRPLQNLVGGVRSLPAAEFKPLALEGPAEVQELARAYNEMSEKVKENQQAQRDFIANVSHELKTPLTSIQGFAQSIYEGAVQQPEKINEAGRVIFTEAQRMNRLVLDLLTLARLESGISDLKPAPVSLKQLLVGVVEKFQPQALAAGLELSLEAGEDLTVVGDGDRLAQVFDNLADNAIKFTPSGGKITIKMGSDGKFAAVDVIDNGAGIPPPELGRIFERFYQVEKSRKGGASHGSGLGLSIAEQIVNAHAGKIRVESVSGTGSKFTVLLPFAAEILH